MTELLLDALTRLLKAVPLTLGVTAGALVVGLVLALPVAFMRVSRVAALRWLANTYILCFRGTPTLVQIYLVYYGAGQFEWIRSSALWLVLREPLWCAIIALGMNSAAYTGKMLSGAIQAVPRGTVEAAQALGLSPFRAMRLVTLPLAIRQALPAYGNEVILTLKASSLASTITVLEITGVARVIVSDTYAPYEVFALAGAFYLILTFLFTRFFALLERQLHASVAPARNLAAVPSLDATR